LALPSAPAPSGGGDNGVGGDGGDGARGTLSGHSSKASSDRGSETTAGSPAILAVGRIVKPHGLRGDVIVSLTTNRDERVARGSILSDSDGRAFEVVRSSSHQGRFIVTFGGVNGIDEANALRDTQLFAPPLDDPDQLWVHDLIGSRVEDTAGLPLGVVKGVEANPASDLLVLDGGGLIPLRFVVGNDPGVLITVDIPDGLLDLG
jgi:16S rRNA processing protein RimM